MGEHKEQIGISNNMACQRTHDQHHHQNASIPNKDTIQVTSSASNINPIQGNTNYLLSYPT